MHLLLFSKCLLYFGDKNYAIVSSVLCQLLAVRHGDGSQGNGRAGELSLTACVSLPASRDSNQEAGISHHGTGAEAGPIGAQVSMGAGAYQVAGAAALL